jgi:hypothetical protein
MKEFLKLKPQTPMNFDSKDLPLHFSVEGLLRSAE